MHRSMHAQGHMAAIAMLVEMTQRSVPVKGAPERVCKARRVELKVVASSASERGARQAKLDVEAITAGKLVGRDVQGEVGDQSSSQSSSGAPITHEERSPANAVATNPSGNSYDDACVVLMVDQCLHTSHGQACNNGGTQRDGSINGATSSGAGAMGKAKTNAVVGEEAGIMHDSVTERLVDMALDALLSEASVAGLAFNRLRSEVDGIRTGHGVFDPPFLPHPRTGHGVFDPRFLPQHDGFQDDELDATTDPE